MSITAEKSAPAIRLAGAWFVLALMALGLSAVFAVVLVVARTPFLGQGAGLFQAALVLHVDLAVHVWFLAIAAGTWSLMMRTAAAPRWAGFVLGSAGTLAVLCAPLIGEATPILSNYVPLLDHPVFLAGLAVFALGVGLTGLLATIDRQRDIVAPWRLAANAAALALLATAAVAVLDFFAGSTAVSGVGVVDADDRLWGVGHSMQFVHILLLMAAWCALGAEAISQVPALPRILPVLLGLSLIPAVAAPLISVTYVAGTAEYRQAYTELMRWGTWPGAAALGLALIVGLLRVRRQRRLTTQETGLALSLFLFAAGCALGATIRGESLAVPAHYHGTVGAITLAYLLWLRAMAPDFGIAAANLSRADKLPLFYGAGIAILVAGLAIAGDLGIPRKAPHVDLGADSVAYLVAMGTASIGGLAALSAVAAIVVIGLHAAWRTRFPPAVNPAPRRDARRWAVAATVLLVAAGGWLLELMPSSGPQPFSADQHAEDKIHADVKLRFQQGVIMLHAKQYEHALTAFHRVLRLAPEMPEAYVNTGFALIGLKRYKEARDFFESATLLRRSQVNAYYGLGVALDSMGDRDGALGAMQTFVHLAKADDPFRRKAESAIWEWKEIRAAGQSATESAAK